MTSSPLTDHDHHALMRRLVRGLHPASGYSDQPVPLGGYVLLAGVFNALFATGLITQARSGEGSIEPVGVVDLVLLAGATHKLSRLISKDRITSFIRAPFVRYTGSASTHGEVEEEPRGSGLQRSLGELFTCPYCIGQWVAGGLVLGLVFDRRRTRLITGMYSAMTVADFLHLGYLRYTKEVAREQ